MKLCAVSVDLDEIGEYRALHGLPQQDAAAHAVYEQALGRAIALAGRRVPLTLFVIGKDLARARNAELLRAATRDGVVAESHSQSHRYDLARLPADAIHEEIVRSCDVIAAVTDRRPLGFRSPGYGTSAGLYEAVCRAGLVFDASTMPSPGYYLAKLVAMARAGSSSVAVIHPPGSVLGPRQPHRVAGLVEIPMAVTKLARLPVIGTTLTLAGGWAGRLLAGCLGDPVLSLELHGMDFLDQGDGVADLAAHQPDVRLPLSRKLRVLRAVFDDIERAGFSWAPLAEVARCYTG